MSASRSPSELAFDRRAFLATALATASACGAARPHLGEVEATELLVRLERGLSAIREAPPAGGTGALPWELRPGASESVARLGLEALVIADVNRCIPRGADVPSELLGRLQAELPVLEQAVGTFHALLTRMPPAARRLIDRRNRERPEATMQLSEWIDERAASIGVAPDNRLLLRANARELSTRMRRQSASAVIDRSIDKLEIALGRSAGAAAHAREARTAALVEAVWSDVEAPPPPAAYSSVAIPPPPGASASIALVPEVELDSSRWNERWARPGDHDIEIGAILMPFGLVTCTVLLWVGIGVLVHGMNLNSAWDGRTEEETRRDEVE